MTCEAAGPKRKGQGVSPPRPTGHVPRGYELTSFPPRPVAFQPGQLAFLETHYMDHDRRKDRAGHGGQHIPEEAIQLLHWRTLLPGGAPPCLDTTPLPCQTATAPGMPAGGPRRPAGALQWCRTIERLCRGDGPAGGLLEDVDGRGLHTAETLRRPCPAPRRMHPFSAALVQFGAAFAMLRGQYQAVVPKEPSRRRGSLSATNSRGNAGCPGSGAGGAPAGQQIDSQTPPPAWCIRLPSRREYAVHTPSRARAREQAG